MKKVVNIKPRMAGTTLAGTLIMGFAIFTVTEALNPDWFGYAAIYESGGGWLKEQNRDPLFTMLIVGAEYLLGPDNYEQFRLLVGLYFVYFTYALVSGRIVNYKEMPALNGLTLLPLLTLMTPRFTVQIREGLAVTLVIMAIGYLWRQPNRRTSDWLIGLILFLLAGLMHSSIIILWIALLLGTVVTKLTNGSAYNERLLIVFLSMFSTILMCASLIYLQSTNLGSSAIDFTFGWLVGNSSGMTLEKWVYWLTIGTGLSLVVKQLWSVYKILGLPAVLRGFVGVKAFVLLPAIYFGAITLLILDAPPILVSSLSRFMNLLLVLLLMLLIFAGRMNRSLAIFSVFVFVDQIRVIVESIGTTSLPASQ